jgi:hypothetical protein
MALLGAERQEGTFVSEGERPSFCRAERSCYVWGRRIAEYEELNEGAEDQYDGELAE